MTDLPSLITRLPPDIERYYPRNVRRRTKTTHICAWLMFITDVLFAALILFALVLL